MRSPLGEPSISRLCTSQPVKEGGFDQKNAATLRDHGPVFREPVGATMKEPVAHRPRLEAVFDQLSEPSAKIEREKRCRGAYCRHWRPSVSVLRRSRTKNKVAAHGINLL